VVLLCLAFPAGASAAVFQVTTTSDPVTGTCLPGNCSLREAIVEANLGSGSDTVLVPAGTYTLETGQLMISNGMHIVGTSGPGATVIDAHGASGIIRISGSASTVSISGLSMRRGLASPEGSAIADVRASGAQLALSEDVFTLNSNGGAGSGSGAVSVEGAGTKSLTVTNSSFARNNAGSEGGAIPNSGQGSGGAIAFRANGTLAVANSAFSENTAGGNGGAGESSGQGKGGAISARALGNGSAVSISNSTFSANRAGGNGGAGTSSGNGYGGAINFFGEGATDAFSITGSTFTGNQAGGSAGFGKQSGEGFGGAIVASLEGSLSLTNDTVVGNSVGGPIGATSGGGTAGGGLASTRPATLVNDTFDANAAIGGQAGASEIGGNIDGNPGPFTLKNTIVAGGSAVVGPNCSGAFTSSGHNIDDRTAAECGLKGALGDIVANPMLGPLQANGGPTQTQVPLAGSPAIDAGDNNGCPTTDQRGVLRPQGGACDIGAYELAPPNAATGGATGVRTTSATLTGLATNPDVLGATMFFQWGRTRSYGSQTPAQALAAGGATAFSAALSSLAPDVTYHFRAVVINPDGTSIGSDQTFTTATPPPIKKPPRITLASLTGLRETNSVFTVNFASTPLTAKTTARHPRGTVFIFRLNKAATVKITIQTTARGRRVHGKCRAESKRLRRRPRCTRVLTIVTLTRAAHRGVNRVRFSGRINGRALSARRYKAVFTAINAAGASPAQSLTFTIVRR
jgi:CSLREA domain-containing protein